MFGSLDSMVGQLTSIGAPGGTPVDASDPLGGALLLLILLLVCAGGAGAASKAAGGAKPYKPEDVKSEDIADGMVRIIEVKSGRELFKGSKVDARKWRADNVEGKYAPGGPKSR